jgi:hypothetical protein
VAGLSLHQTLDLPRLRLDVCKAVAHRLFESRISAHLDDPPVFFGICSLSRARIRWTMHRTEPLGRSSCRAT